MKIEELDKVYNEDCLQALRRLPDNCVDLVVTDPPYEFNSGSSGGAFGANKRCYRAEYMKLGETNVRIHIGNTNRLISDGFDMAVLSECCRVLKKINAYVWCSKLQLRKLLTYFEEKGCTTDVLVWCKTNPTPACNNSYLSDIEYCVYAREKGVKLYGTMATKHRYWLTPANTADKKLYNHPTIKPLNIIQTLIINSSKPNDIVLDPFMGSGTTAVACHRTGRHFIGYEINEKYYNTACKRIDIEQRQTELQL